MAFTGQVLVITGASGGIGAELARQLAAERPRLVLAARIFPGVVATEIRRHGLNADGVAAGVSGLAGEDAMSVEECARQMIAAMRARKRELVMTGRARLAMWIKPVAPQWVDRIALAALHKTHGGRR